MLNNIVYMYLKTDVKKYSCILYGSNKGPIIFNLQVVRALNLRGDNLVLTSIEEDQLFVPYVMGVYLSSLNNSINFDHYITVTGVQTKFK